MIKTRVRDPVIKTLARALNARQLTEVPVTVKLCRGYYVVQGDTGMGFGVYIPSEGLILLADIAPGIEREIARKEFFAQNLGHEYKHHLQHVNGEPYDEDSADAFAQEFMKSVIAV